MLKQFLFKSIRQNKQKVLLGCIVLGIFLFLVYLFFPSETAAKSVSNQHRLQENASRSEILLCSELKEVSANSIEEFHLRYFSGWSNLNIQSGLDYSAGVSNDRVVFLASDGDLNDVFKSCIRNLFPKSESVQRFVEEVAFHLGRKMELNSKSAISEYYGETEAIWSFREFDGVFVILFISNESEPYRSNHAHTFLFGLDISICEYSSICNK